MSDFFDNKEHDLNEQTGADPAHNPEQDAPVTDEYDEYQTIFGDPTMHADKKPKNAGRKRLVAMISGVLAIAVLVGSAWAVVRFIPKKEDDTDTGSAFEGIKVLDLKSDDFSSVTVTNNNGTFTFRSKKVEATASSSTDSTGSGTTATTEWSIDGLDHSKTNSSSIASIVSGAATITATREITTKTAEQCGLDNPSVRVDVTVENKDDFSVLVGTDSPDGSGKYLKLSNTDKIYLVESSVAERFDFDLLSLADTTAFPAMTVANNMADYLDGEGKITKFDKLTVSGSNFAQPVVIEMNNLKDMTDYVAYKVTSPTQRIADKVDDVFKLFTEGLAVSGAYAYDVSAGSLAAVGLDKPDIIVTIEVAGNKQTYKIKKVDSEYCAVVRDDSKMIRKVSLSSIIFADYNVESFYASWVCLQSINELSNFTLSTGGVDYSFDIVYDSAEDAKETYVITHNGKKLTASNFQSFYQHFVGLSCIDFTTENLNTPPETTVTLHFTNGSPARVITFTKSSETKYQYTIDGTPMGKITSSSYVKLLDYVEKAAQDKKIK